MPGMDGTGPMGTGPIGGGRGPCGRGMGRGRGMGMGNRFGQGGSYDPRLRGNWFGRIWGRQSADANPTADRTELEEKIRVMEIDLQAARQQLEALEPPVKE